MKCEKEFSSVKRHGIASAVLKQSFIHVNIRAAVSYQWNSEIRPLCLETHLSGLKHLFKKPRDENKNTGLVTIDLKVAKEMSQHEFIMKGEMTYKL